MRTSGPRPSSKDSRSEKIPIRVEEIVSMLRIEVYLSEAQNVVIRLYCAGDSRILELIDGTESPASSRVKKEASSSKSIQETLQLLVPLTSTLEI